MMSDNELIAIFMGWRIEGEPEFTKPYEIWVSETGARMYPRTDHRGNRYPDEFKFHTSWDWLMPVVEKIDDLEDGKYIVTIEPMITIISNMGEAPITEVQFDGRLKNTYTAVVEFIKWHNQQQS